MAKIRPLKALRYGDSVEHKELVVSPPYDVISKEDRIRYHARDPRNVVWVDYGLPGRGENEKYERAGDILSRWVKEKVVEQDESPSYYYYEQEFEIEGRGTYVRTGFICALELERFGEGSIFPHERTLHSPKVDRLTLMKHTKVATSPIFGIYDDEENLVISFFSKAIRNVSPHISVTDDGGVRHRMWVVSDKSIIDRVSSHLEDRRVFIADGHHRYETALLYRDWMRERGCHEKDGSWNHVLIFLSASGDDGLVILPTHRGVYGLNDGKFASLVDDLSKYFEIKSKKGPCEDLLREVASPPEGEHRIGMMGPGKEKYVIISRGYPEAGEESPPLPREVKELDVSILHGIILEKVLHVTPLEITSGEKVKFFKGLDKGLKELEEGEIDLLFCLNPVSMSQFMEVSLSGHTLPQKTTYFYPKILTGLVFFPVGERDRVG